MTDWTAAAEKIYEKSLAVAARMGGRIPYLAEEGRYRDADSVSWWTNGFYAGLLWQLREFRESALFRELASAIENKLDENFLLAQGMDHDSGFKWLLTAGADYRVTKSEASRNRLLLAADNLAGRWNPAGGFLRAWNGEGLAGRAIIDCLMNLPLLFFAEELTGDRRYRHIALAHARTAQKYFVREDGSCRHIVDFDPCTGEFLRADGGQGIGENSAWTRGQAWAVYGFTLVFLHSGEEAFLGTAMRCADFFLAALPKDGLVPADFSQAASCPFEDDSAAAAAACGLLELARASGKEKYHMGAENMLSALWKERCDLNASHDNLLTRCTVSYHGGPHNVGLIYGDYFFVEAIGKLIGRGIFLW